MDAKDLRTESALSERNNDGSKYSQSGGIALHCDRNKSYQDIGSNSLAKVDVQSARPCAVIGPDRVVPPSAPNEAYLKKGPSEPWPCMDNAYHTRRPPEYPHKLTNFQNPTRNISPRQTFQENMQRIMVPPSYSSVKISDDNNYVQIADRSNALPKNIKINVPPEAKFCDVPYNVYPNNNEQKNVRNAEMCISSVNPTLTRTASHGWAPGSVNIRPTRTYGAPELYQYQEYPSCAGPRPVVPRPNRTVPEESGYVYADPFYHQEGNIRFKPYPAMKDRFPQQRYEYINYANSFHPPPPFPTHKYELQKTVPPHPYPPYPPIKYLDRVPEPVMEGYQRNQQGNYNIPYRNQIIHPNYGPVLGNCPQNKLHSYPPDAHIKTLGPNKLPFDNTKAYIEYDNGRPKMYPPSESYLVNEMGRVHSMKSQVIMPNYPTLNMHNIPNNPYYKKDNQQIKNYEYLQAHFRSMDPNLNIHNPMIRHPPVFSPNTSAISPTDSSTSNDTSQTLGTSQEDCGYVSQSSTASARSIDSGINRIPNDCLRKYYDSRYGPIIRTAPMMSKSELTANHNSKEKKNIDVRQFLQMWNEGDDETEENNSKDIMIQSGPKNDHSFIKAHEVISQSNQEQLYVLGLVNVPSEELGKYEHIQKVSKLPENIKGYNHLELLNQFEEAIESSNMPNYKTPTPKDFQMTSKVVPPKQTTAVVPPRPLSPLDVEAKISQSVIHKEVGCNFEIKPCSPKMLNVEVATPVQNILVERAIEKVANPVMLKSPRLNGIDENMDCNIMKRKEHRININNEPVRIPSCKMVNTQFSNNNSIDSIKNSYSLQDLESNSGLCLASLPRLDNDIELNFPEVNQQFINANKGDSSAAASLRDLPSLELLDQSDGQNKDKQNDINSLNKVKDVLKSPCVIDSEKEFSKLSKYRKTKTLSSDSKENQTHVMSVINAARTDSVIIKNPENAKNHEDKITFSPNCLNKQIRDIQQVPINLTSQGNITENATKTLTGIKPHCKKNDAQIEIAIDFSLNKNSSNENDECIETKASKDTENLTHDSMEGDHSILDDHLSKLPTFSDCEQNIQDSFINSNKIYENTLCSPIKYNDSETVPHLLKDKDNLSLIDNPPLGRIFTKNKCLNDSVEEVKDVDDAILSVASLNQISNDNNNSLIPIEFVTPAVLLRSDSTSSSYLMDIDKHNDTIEKSLHNSHNSLIENDLEVNNPKNDINLDDKDVLDVAVTNIEEMKVNMEDSLEVVNTKKTVDSDLDNDVSDDNINQKMDDSSVVKDPKILHCNNFDITHKKILDHDAYKSNNTNQCTDSNCDVISNNIVTHSRHDDRTESNNRVTELSLPSPNNMLTHQSINFQFKEHERDTDFNSSSPRSIGLLSPKSYLSELSEQEAKLELLSPTDTDMNSKEDDEVSETVVEYNLPIANNMTKNSANTYQSEVPEQATLNLASLNNITADIPKDDQTSFSQSASRLDLSPSNHIAAYEPTDDNLKNNDTISLLQEISDNRIDVFDTKEIQHKDVLVKDVEENSEIHGAVKLPLERAKHIDLGVRYLSYGSKAMYSPRIQKLVLYCEGNTKNISKEEYKFPTNCALLKAEQIKTSCDFDHSNNVLHYCNIDSKTLAGTNNPIVTDNLDDFSVTTESSKDDISNICKDDCKTTKDEDDKIDESDKLYNSSTFKENDELNPIIESAATDSRDQYIKNNIATSTGSSLANDFENHYDKLGTLSNFGVVRHCLSPEVQERWDTGSNCSHKAHEEWDIHSNCSDEISGQWDNQSFQNVVSELNTKSGCKDEVSERCNKQFECIDDMRKELDTESNKNDLISNQWDKKSNCDDVISERSDNQSHNSDIILERSDIQSNSIDIVPERLNNRSECSDEVRIQWDEQSTANYRVMNQMEKQTDCNNQITAKADKVSNSDEEIHTKLDRHATCNNTVVESTTIMENDTFSLTKVQTTDHTFMNKKRQPLKRSLSDSALNIYNNNNNEHTSQENEENVQFIWPFKRRKIINNDTLAQDLCNIIQNNRRNSISAIYNEENVSFCILIDNDCIITAEESDEQEKICYTELSEDCLAEIHNECTNDEESVVTMTEVISDISAPQEEIDCEYSDSFVMQGENEKLEESWVEDVGCVETVISDDIAADIEISEPISPKEDLLSDNDESGVFSSSEHTDKVKYIYGDKMCNDDAQFVETLYNTPQMDVNKTLVQRETQVSGEYYDNDSLEKILSESNDQDLSTYMPEYIEPVFSPGIVDVKETVENKENLVIEMIPSLQNQISGFDVVDTGIDHHENMKLCELFDETQDDTVHSCESSVDNVFRYKENDDNINYTSSSPEVSSTTSEEKKSAILLKITNYQGSRISQVNDINRDAKRPSCKFTEDKDYVQSQSNFSAHRPLLTKAAQKYIPPLKESMRDLKVKLSLPQHSLMKLKQLKISKDEPKVCKQNVSVPRVSKKPKPKFEDVLKSLDEIQIKMHKEKTKKSKKSIPKVVIKKNENGSHYASTSNKDEFNPDLTGRKWQPWVFIEKNHFIDKMAVKKKTKAIYSHRKRTYVLAEKFQKYKSVNSAKFVISPPISDCPSSGLKYTIRLKHSY